ncbi:hypothetical protein [Nostoc sp.]
MAQTQPQHDTLLSSATTVENVHSRLVQRECKVFAAALEQSNSSAKY